MGTSWTTYFRRRAGEANRAEQGDRPCAKIGVLGPANEMTGVRASESPRPSLAAVQPVRRYTTKLEEVHCHVGF